MLASLHARVLIAASLVLAAFLGLTGLVLDRAFKDSVEAASKERLQAYVYALLAVAEVNAKGSMVVLKPLAEPRFSLPGSGLYAEIRSPDGTRHWRSLSLLGITLDYSRTPDVGVREFEFAQTSDGAEVYVLSLGVTWDNEQGQQQRYSFRVAEDLEGMRAQLTRFRHSLWGWLGAAALLLLAVQGSILRWGLTPLREVADDLGAIESGRARQLQGDYPKELRGLTDNINTLISSSRSHLQRYRDSLGNVAHSLKTPLAVLRAAVESKGERHELPDIVQEQVERMTQIVDYQLRRAAASGSTTLTAPVNVAHEVKKLIAAMQKVYIDKHVQCETDIPADVVFYGDRGDLLEILGNLTDNAFKWCRQRVKITARMEIEGNAHNHRLILCVQDDGPGIAADMYQRVLQRGQRGDTSTDGQGIGLAMVQETVRIYQGKLTIGRSPLGGAQLEVTVG